MGTLSLSAPLVLIEKSRLWAGTGFHLIPSFHHHPTQGWRMSRAHSYSHSKAHFPTFSSLHLLHSSFSNPSFASPTSQRWKAWRMSSVHLRHSSFSNPSVALPTSQLILLPFRCFTYVTAHSPTLLSLLLRHRLFTYVTWRGAQALW